MRHVVLLGQLTDSESRDHDAGRFSIGEAANATTQSRLHGSSLTRRAGTVLPSGTAVGAVVAAPATAAGAGEQKAGFNDLEIDASALLAAHHPGIAVLPRIKKGGLDLGVSHAAAVL